MHFKLRILQRASRRSQIALRWKWERFMAPKESQPWTVPGLSLDLVFIRPGTFTMGSDNGSDNEKPLTVVTLTRGFWLGSTEATQGLWEVLMGDTAHGNRPGCAQLNQASGSGLRVGTCRFQAGV